MNAVRQAEIDQPSQELEMRRMSDNARLSDTAAKQLAGAGQRNGRKGLACPLSHNFSAKPYALRSWTTAMSSSAPHRS